MEAAVQTSHTSIYRCRSSHDPTDWRILDLSSPEIGGGTSRVQCAYRCKRGGPLPISHCFANSALGRLLQIFDRE